MLLLTTCPNFPSHSEDRAAFATLLSEKVRTVYRYGHYQALK